MELVTALVTLRPPSPDDAVDALAMLQDPEVALWNPAPRVVDVATAREWCASGADWSDGTHATWHAVARTTGRLVGNCSLFAVDGEQAVAKIGYRVAPWARRHGVGTDMVDAVSRWAFAELGLARIQLEHAAANAASCAVATRAGFVLEGTLRSASVDGTGRRHDDHVHGRLATDPGPGEPRTEVGSDPTR